MNFDFSKIEGFDWDKGNLEHIKKHSVHYTECEEVFSNKPLLINEDKEHSIKETRFHALGIPNKGRILFITFTVRDNKVRVISAREANRKERETLRKIGGEKK